MRRSHFLGFVLFLSVAASARADAKEDLQKLEGVWKVDQAVKDGKALGEEQTKSMRVIIKDGKFTIKDGKYDLESTVTVDPSQKPAAIDLEPTVSVKKGSAPGIYLLEGDKLKICWAGVGGKRPTEFFSNEQSKTRLFVLTREK